MNEEKEPRATFSSIAYYLIIAFISIIVTGFFPMLSSEIGLEFNIPNTWAGWTVWAITKLSIAAVNMCIFFCFMQQAKINVRNNENYIKANKLLEISYKKKPNKPKAPNVWSKKQYLSKGTTLFTTSILSTIGFSQAILTFNLVEFFSELYTVVMAIIFGYLQMKKAEEYWTSEYYSYALMISEEDKGDNKNEGAKDLQEHTGTSTTEQV